MTWFRCSDNAELGTKSITANGTYNAADDDLDGYSSVTVNISGLPTYLEVGEFTLSESTNNISIPYDSSKGTVLCVLLVQKDYMTDTTAYAQLGMRGFRTRSDSFNRYLVYNGYDGALTPSGQYGSVTDDTTNHQILIEGRGSNYSFKAKTFRYILYHSEV